MRTRTLILLGAMGTRGIIRVLGFFVILAILLLLWVSP